MKTFQASKEGLPCNHENNPILRRWEQVASAKRGEPAIYAPDGNVLRSFAEIEEEARRWAERLTSSVGGAVCLQTGNCAAWPALLLAAWRLGRPVLPMEGDVPIDQRGRLEELCGVHWRLVQRGREIEPVSVQHSPQAGDLRSDLLKVTSGTTTEPRVIRFAAAQLLADCDNICDTMGLREDDRNYGVISFAHSYGFSNLITPLLCRGVRLVAAWDSIPRALVNGLSSSQATVFPAVPALFRTLGELGGVRRPLRLCISAGAPLPREVARRFFVDCGLKIHSFYGASECGGICYDPGESPEVEDGYVGPPLTNVDVRMEGPAPSRIEVRGKAVGLGYHPAGESETLGDGVFRPSDLLEQREDGYVIAGRLSDVINVAGRKVNPREIERVLRRSPRVRDVVVLGIPAGSRGEEVAACVAGDATEDELRRLCSGSLPGWQIPRRWLFCAEIPVNARGKISRADLRARIS